MPELEQDIAADRRSGWMDMVGLVLLVEGIGSVGVWEFSSSSSLSRSKSVIFAAGLLTGRDLCSVGKAKVGGGRAAGG